MSECNSFARLASINVGSHIEKKGNLSYLSWAWAVDQLLRADPTATWEYRHFGDLPYLLFPDQTAMVFCTVTAFGQRRTMQLPVMDHKNRPIQNPDSFAVNTAMQRALVKSIGCHGIGIYIYAGEDLPTPSEEQPAPPKEETAPPPPPITPINGQRASASQVRYIERLIEETGSDLGKVLDYFNVGSINELTTQTASRAIKSLEKNRRAA